MKKSLIVLIDNKDVNHLMEVALKFLVVLYFGITL